MLVTGGNSGIGTTTAAGLARLGSRVVITSRDEARGRAAIEGLDGDVECMQLDLASLRNVRAFADAFLDRYERLDVLVNNAGLLLTTRSTTEDGFETTFGVNHLGPFLLTNLLLDRLRSSVPSRIVNVASSAHRKAKRGIEFEDLHLTQGYNQWRAYGQSKLANILFTRELARRLAGTGVTAYAVHPGTVRTGFAGDGDSKGWLAIGIKIAHPFMLSPEKGARTSVWAASAPGIESMSGGYFVKMRPAKTSKVAKDDDAARRLWEVSERLVGLTSSSAGAAG